MIQFRVDGTGPSPRTVAPPPPGRGSRLTERVAVSEDWRASAACRQQTGVLGYRRYIDGELRPVWLYPELHLRSTVIAARDLCTMCPVIKQCAALQLRVGVSAGVVYWGEGRPASMRRLSSKRCDWCNGEMVKHVKYCSLTCKDAYHYDRKKRLAAGSLPAGPLLALFDDDAPVSRIARACGVAARSVYRWQIDGRMTLSTAEGAARRLGMTIDDIWGPR